MDVRGFRWGGGTSRKSKGGRGRLVDGDGGRGEVMIWADESGGSGGMEQGKKEIEGLTIGEAKRRARSEAGKWCGLGDDECLNEGGKGHHTRTQRPHLDLDWPST